MVDAELASILEGGMLRLARHQVSAADIVILNKTDLVDEAARTQARDWVMDHAPRARVIEVGCSCQ